MNILTVGDSYAYGDELVDRLSAWPYLLANLCDSKVVNLGEPGASNDRIVKKTIEHLIDPHIDKVDLVVIGWTNLGRIEFADEFGTFDIWPGCVLNSANMSWRDEIVRYINQYHSNEFFYKKFLQQVILMQGWLKSLNINYVMANTVQFEYYKKFDFEHKKNYFSQVDREKFIDFDQLGMQEWATGLPRGAGGHFLEEAHKVVAERIYEHIRNLGWVS